MLITVFCAPRDRPETTFALDVSPDLELRDFVALCELESGIPAGDIQIMYTEQPLIDLTRALGNYGVKDGDVVVLRQADRRPLPTQPAFPGLPHIDFRSITVPGTSSSAGQRAAPRQPLPPQPAAPQQSSPPARLPAPLTPAPQPSTPAASRASGSGSGSSLPGLDDPALLQQMLLSNPHELSLLKERNPPLAEALLSGDLERFTKVLVEQQQDRARREQERIRLLTADPFDLEAQAKIEEDIRQHNVEENMTIAMEEAPESFGQVVMLYINCRVNGHPVKAFVDSGAQMTIMSQACAERCNIMRLVDRRWAGIAKGVGTQKIIGRVHLAQVQIEGIFLPCSFSILEDQPMDMLLGLDMLKRHQCSIDLKKNVLLIGTTATETCFLPEAELPDCARLAYGPEAQEETRPEELADRELAEALQRSIQESDTADGQTTSPTPPAFPAPSPPDHSLPSPSSWAADGRTTAPSCTQGAPAPPPEPSRAPPGLQGPTEPPLLPREDSPSACDRQALPPAAASPAPPAPSFPEEEMAIPPPPGEQEPAEIHCDSDGMRSPAELAPHQPMEQESSHAHPAPASHSPPSSPSPQPLPLPADPDLDDPTCAEMASPPCEAEGGVPEGGVHPERVQPEGEHCPHNTPSLASALRELHQLLVSNGCTGSQDTPCPHPQPCPSTLSCPHPQPCPPTLSCPHPQPCPPTLSCPHPQSCPLPQPCPPTLSCTPTQPCLPAEPCTPTQWCPPEQPCTPTQWCPPEQPCTPTQWCPPEQPCRLDDGGRAPQPTDSEDPEPPSAAIEPGGAEPSDDAKANHATPAAATAAGEQEEAGSGGLGPTGQEGRASREEPDSAEGQGPPPCPDGCWGSRAEGQETSSSGPPPQAQLEVREPPEGQQGRGVADGRASGTCTPDSLGPVAAPPLPSAPSRERFPAEHLQRIQAEGFSAREALEALEQAQGVVELALLTLLARNITVPT